MKPRGIASKIYLAIAILGGLVIIGYFAMTLRLHGEIIFVGAVTQIEDVAAPVQADILKGQDRASSVHFKVRHVWQGPDMTEITAYTWPRGTAPCENADLKTGRNYIVSGKWDDAHKSFIFDTCKILSDDTTDSPIFRRELDRFLKPEKKN